MYTQFGRAGRRIVKEIEQLKKTYPVVIIGGKEGEVIMIVIESIAEKTRGKPITITVHLVKGYPFEKPSMDVFGFQISPFEDRGDPSKSLQDLVSNLIQDIQAAENDIEFVTVGRPFVGKHHTIMKEGSHMIGQSLCSTCPNTSNVICGQCLTTLYCSASCQEADWQSHALVCGKAPLPEQDMEYLVDYVATKTGLRKLDEPEAEYKARIRSLINNLRAKERAINETDEEYAKRIVRNIKSGLRAKQKAATAVVVAPPPSSSKPDASSSPSPDLLKGVFEMEDMSALFRAGAVTAAQIQKHVTNLILVEMDMMSGKQHGYIKQRGIYETIRNVLQEYEKKSDEDDWGKDVVILYDLQTNKLHVAHDVAPSLYSVELWRK